jgi:diaphanous 2
VSAKAACEEVKESKKFGTILELILLIGNIMNTGTKNAQSIGFNISYLPKLNNTKDRENKYTLLYFLVEHIEKDYPELISFADEMNHIDSASRVNLENIQKLLKQMDDSIKALEMDLKNNAKAAREKDDRFAQAMGEFYGEARAECDVLNGMFKDLENLYSDLEKFYVFDKQKYHLEEFMSDIKTFIKQFKDAYTQMMKEREADEKLLRFREAREKLAQFPPKFRVSSIPALDL